MIKIRVGLPSVNGQVTPPTKETLDKLRAYNDIKFEIVKVDNGQTVRGRNIASQPVPKDAPASKKLIMPYDYYLAMDDDMAFTPENIRRLIDHDKDIIGASYSARTSRTDLIVAGFLKLSNDKDNWLRAYDIGLKEVDWTGAGCLLIKKQVFEKMDYPYWTHDIYEDGDVRDICSEDIGFCINARKAGYKIYCDLSNRVAHIPK